jgi:hypothetical protein
VEIARQDWANKASFTRIRANKPLDGPFKEDIVSKMTLPGDEAIKICAANQRGITPFLTVIVSNSAIVNGCVHSHKLDVLSKIGYRETRTP